MDVNVYKAGFIAGATDMERWMNKAARNPDILTRIPGERAPNPDSRLARHWRPPSYSQIKGAQELIQLRAAEVAIAGNVATPHENIRRVVLTLWSNAQRRLKRFKKDNS